MAKVGTRLLNCGRGGRIVVVRMECEEDQPVTAGVKEGRGRTKECKAYRFSSRASGKEGSCRHPEFCPVVPTSDFSAPTL